MLEIGSSQVEAELQLSVPVIDSGSEEMLPTVRPRHTPTKQPMLPAYIPWEAGTRAISQQTICWTLIG